MAKREYNLVFTLKDRFSRKFNRLKKDAKSFGSSLLRLTGIAGGVSAALGAISGARAFAGAIASAIDFEEQLSKVRGVSQATQAELDAIKGKANELGAATRFTATEAAQGMEELARAGLKTDEILGTIGPALNLAQANAIELADAAQITTTSLNQFGKGAGDATRFADVLTAATQNSAQNLTELANALEFAGPEAARAGLEIEQTAAIIGKLADVGFRGEKGGTALRNALIELQDPTSKFRQELSGLGISSTNFLEVLDQLAIKGDDSAAALLALGKRAGPAITTLVKSGTGDLKELIGTLGDAGGAAARTAAEMDNNLSGALKGLNSAWDSLRRALVEPLLEPLKVQAQELAAEFRRFAASPQLNQIGEKLREIFTEGAQALKNFIAEFDFQTAYDTIVDFLGGAVDAIRAFGEKAGGIVSGVGKVFDGLAVVVNGFKTAVQGAVGGMARLGQIAAEINQYSPFARMTIGAERLTQATEFFRSVADEAFSQAGESADATRDALDSLLGITNDLTEGTRLQGEQSEQTARDVLELGDGVDSLSAAERSAAQAAEEANAALSDQKAIVEDTAPSIDQLKINLQGLRDEYAALQSAGLGLTDEARNLEGQIERLQRQIKGATEETGSLTDAFTILGIQSQEELRNLASQAERAFGIVVAQAKRGAASQEDVRRAFVVMAQAQLDAADASDEATQRQVVNQIQQRASALNVRDALEDLGIAGEEAGDKVESGAEKGTEALEEQERQVKKNTKALKENADAAEQVEQAQAPVRTVIRETGESAQTAAASLGEFTDEQQRLIDGLFSGLGIGQNAARLRTLMEDIARASDEAASSAEREAAFAAASETIEQYRAERERMQQSLIEESAEVERNNALQVQRAEALERQGRAAQSLKAGALPLDINLRFDQNPNANLGAPVRLDAFQQRQIAEMVVQMIRRDFAVVGSRTA